MDHVLSFCAILLNNGPNRKEAKALLIFFNGKFSDSETPLVKATDRGITFADGLYDIVRFEHGHFPFVEDHHRRMKNSADFFGMKMPYTLEEVIGVGEELSVRNEIKIGEMYLALTRGVDSMRDHVFEGDYTPTFVEIVQPIRKVEPMSWQDGTKVVLYEDRRHLLCEHKTMDLLPNVLAKNYARANGGYDAMMFRKENGRMYVTEGGSSSYAFSDGERLIVPELDNILPGITRAKVLNIAKEMGMDVVERRVWIDELPKMKEAILMSTVSKVMPIARVDGMEFGIGAITRKLMEAFEDLLVSV